MLGGISKAAVPASCLHFLTAQAAIDFDVVAAAAVVVVEAVAVFHVP